MSEERDPHAALDAGGYARLDVSDLLQDKEQKAESEDNPGANAAGLCDWCAERRGGGEYFVVADNRHYELCPTCWGRSPGYVELRHLGLPHEAALRRLGVLPEAAGT